MIKKFLALIFSTAIACNFGTAGHTEIGIEENTDEYFEILMRQQQDAVEANEILLSSFDDDGTTVLYPDDYAGDYIGDDNMLHVLVTSDVSIDMYRTILEEYASCVLFEVVDNSFNDLMMLSEEIVEALPEGSCCENGVDVINNKAQIGINTSYSDYILNNTAVKNATYSDFGLDSAAFEYDEELEEYVYQDKVIFEFGFNNVQAEASYMAGNGITISGTGTLGGSGAFTGSTGSSYVALVTAGHCAAREGQTAYIGGNNVGNVVVRQYADDQYGDYSIILANSGITASNIIIAGSGNIVQISGYINNPPVGMYVYKYGISSQKAYCKITKTSLDVIISGTTVKGMTKAEVVSGDSLSGDSGGPYWNGSKFCGIHSALATADDTKYVYFTPNYYLYSRGFVIATS